MDEPTTRSIPYEASKISHSCCERVKTRTDNFTGFQQWRMRLPRARRAIPRKAGNSSEAPSVHSDVASFEIRGLTMAMKNGWLRYGAALASMMVLSVVPPLGCGGSKTAGGCSVNGVYYPDGNAGNGQCTCPPIGPCTITWTTAVVGRMRVLGRTGFTTTVLSRDSVLITGGTNGTGATLNTALIFDPLTRTFTPLAAEMTSHRAGHAATLLPDGTVLLTGGRNENGTVLNTAELYDPTSRTFASVAAQLVTGRAEHSAMLLPNGKVLLAGGQDGATTLDTAELYDPVARTFTALSARMTTPRQSQTAMLLPSGEILLSGGAQNHDVQLSSTELYDPAAKSFTVRP
jgi:Galactose oxidase, central domain/Kelch motif